MKKRLFLIVVVLIVSLFGCSEKENKQANKQIEVSIGITAPDKTLLPETKIDVPYGQNVFDLTKDICFKNNIEFKYEGSGSFSYIKKIGDYSEKKYNTTSGWVYEINNEPVMKSAGEKILQNNDRVLWKYVK